jgi:hypothetical protein
MTMQTVAHSAPVFYATYTAPDGEQLSGTAQETLSGILFLDEHGFTPFYAARRAVHLHGIVALAEAQRQHDALAASLA